MGQSQRRERGSGQRNPGTVVRRNSSHSSVDPANPSLLLGGKCGRQGSILRAGNGLESDQSCLVSSQGMLVCRGQIPPCSRSGLRDQCWVHNVIINPRVCLYCQTVRSRLHKGQESDSQGSSSYISFDLFSCNDYSDIIK